MFNRLLNSKRKPFPYRDSALVILFDEADIGLSWDEFLGAIEHRFVSVKDLCAV